MEVINGLEGLVPGEIVQRLSAAFAGIDEIATFSPEIAPANPDEPELPLDVVQAESVTVPIADPAPAETKPKKRGKG